MNNREQSFSLYSCKIALFFDELLQIFQGELFTIERSVKCIWHRLFVVRTTINYTPKFRKMQIRSWFLSLSFLTILGQKEMFSQASARGAIASSTREESRGTTYAVVIGISDYVSIPKLNYADDDALLFADFLTKQNICQQKNVHLLINEKATTANIYKELKLVTDSLKSSDLLYFYFAGHGDVESSLESGFLLTYNSEGNNYAATAVELNMLER